MGWSRRIDLKLGVLLLLRRSKHIHLLASVLLNLQLRMEHLLGLLRQVRRLCTIGALDRHDSELGGTPSLHLAIVLLLVLLLLLELQLLLVLLVLLVGRLVDKHNTASLGGLDSLIILVLVAVLSSVLPVGGIRLSLVVPIVHVIVHGLVLLLIMGLAGYGGVGSASNEYTAIHLLLQSKLINKPRSYYFHFSSK